MLSVILPAYNASRFIESAIDSILNQTMQDFELLVVDDGSSDNTRTLIENYRNTEKVVISHNKINLGKIATVNKLLGLSRGTFLTIHDADDFSTQDRFEKIFEFINSNPEYAMVGSNFQTVNEQSDFISSSNLPLTYDELVTSDNIYNRMHGPTVLFKKSVIDEVGGFYRKPFVVAEDIDFTSRVLEKYKSCNLAEPLYNYRINADSITKKVSEYRPERYAVKDLLIKFSEQRRSTGKDALMEGSEAQVDQIVRNAISEWEEKWEEILKDGINRSLYYQLYQNAFKLCVKLILKFPIKIIGYKYLFTILIHRIKS